jgi:hypothetical protein
MDYMRTTYTYGLTLEDVDDETLNGSSDIHIEIEGVELHFEYYCKPGVSMLSGTIRPSQTVGSAFGYALISSKPKNYGVSQFIEVCRSKGVEYIFVTSVRHLTHLKECIIRTVTSYDYPNVVSHLQSLGLVKTKASKSCMATDGRMFMVLKTKVKDKSHAGKWYDVDCLGSMLCQPLTDYIEHLITISNMS